MRKVRENETIQIAGEIFGTLKKKIRGKGVVEFSENIENFLGKIGEIPLPPYIKEKKQDTRRYQTVFALKNGAVAAPTAGLHFTKNILKKLEKKGVEIKFVTLHVGFGTFNSIKTDTVENHEMEEEFFEIPEKTSDSINLAIAQKRRIIACGTTVTRTLESCCERKNGIWFSKPGRGFTKLFITPAYKFKIINGLLTNFHLPKTSLLVLASAFAGRKLILSAYKDAIKNRWRFFSFGDCMLIL